MSNLFKIMKNGPLLYVLFKVPAIAIENTNAFKFLGDVLIFC